MNTKTLGWMIGVLVFFAILFIWFARGSKEVAPEPVATPVENKPGIYESKPARPECEWNVEKFPQGCKG